MIHSTIIDGGNVNLLRLRNKPTSVENIFLVLGGISELSTNRVYLMFFIEKNKATRLHGKFLRFALPLNAK